MKKLAAILLISVLFFNWYGYRLLTVYWQEQADRQMETLLDNNGYDEQSLISIRIPIHSVSYYNSSLNFERVDGQISIGEVSYKYVKRRFFKDSLELMCLPDWTTFRLSTACNEFFRQMNDLTQQPGKGRLPLPGAHHQKDLQKVYTPAVLDYTHPASRGHSVIAGNLPPSSLSVGFIPTALRPPDGNCPFS